MIWIPKFYVQELTKGECINLGLPTVNNTRWKALFVEWFNNGVILYAWRIDNEDPEQPDTVCCPDPKYCCC